MKLHFVLVPFLAHGHMIPMLDLGLILAERGALITYITTPVNARRLDAAVGRAANEAGLHIQLVALRFPAAEVGLPEGCENFDSLPTMESAKSLVAGTFMLQEPLKRFLQEQQKQQQPLPTTCMISDFCTPWTRFVSLELKVPRLVFLSSCCFTLYYHLILPEYCASEGMTDDRNAFVVPGLPHKVEVTMATAPGFFPGPEGRGLRNQAEDAESTADGIVVNSFAAMEPAYEEMFHKARGTKVWTVGPVSTFRKPGAPGRAQLTNEEDTCGVVNWLDSKEAGSVLYVCFGSLVHMLPEQQREIGLGLEASGQPFVWVIRADENSAGVEEWLSGGFEERSRDNGLIIRGWAPQLKVLSHPSVGGFLTHCGWNSTIEGIAAGVPMVTWPCFGDQFLNERMLEDVLGTGVPVGIKEPVMWGSGMMATREQITEAVGRVMGEGEEREGRRKRARELADMAERATEVGGSSYEGIGLMMEDVLHLASNRLEENEC